jgi:hypothetical protein
MANEQLLLAAERLLDNRTITLSDIPERFAARYPRALRRGALARAEAVAALRGALGRSDAVTLEDTSEPIANVERLARDAGHRTFESGGCRRQGRDDPARRNGRKGRAFASTENHRRGMHDRVYDACEVKDRHE